jgi:hypothetical protein
MTNSEVDTEPLGLFIREQIARIDREQAHIHQLQADQHDRQRREIRLAPWQLALSGAGAALFAAGVAFAEVMIGR